jgi:hypothetical protein
MARERIELGACDHMPRFFLGWKEALILALCWLRKASA